MVSPLISTPMATMASSGPEDAEEAGSEVRSLVELPRRSPAVLPPPAEEDWTWEAE